MKQAKILKKISTNAIRKKEVQDKKFYSKVISSEWFIKIIEDIEKKAIIAAEKGKQEIWLDRYKIYPLNKDFLFSETDFLKYVFSRYFSYLGYASWVSVHPIYNTEEEIISYSFTGKISW